MSANLENMAYDVWSSLSQCERELLRDKSNLTPKFAGLEGYRVEVRDGPDSKPRRFIVGKSTGWRPVHLEVKTRRSLGGLSASKDYYSVRIIRKVY